MTRFSVAISPAQVEDVAQTEDDLFDVLTAAGYRVERTAFRRAPMGGWRISAHLSGATSPDEIRTVVRDALNLPADVRTLKGA